LRRLTTWLGTAIGAVVLGLFVVLLPPAGAVAASLIVVVAALLMLGSRDLAGDEVWLRVMLVAWVAYYLSGVPLRIRAASEIEATAVDGAAALRVALVAMIGLVVLAFWFQRRERAASQTGRHGYLAVALLLAYGVLSLMSSLWSVVPLWTAYKSTEYLVGLVLAICVAYLVKTLFDLESIVNTTWGIYIVLLGFVWAGLLLAPARAMVPTGGVLGWRLGGVFPIASTNTVGDLAATVLLIAIVRLAYARGSKRWWTILMVAALGALFLSQARSALLGVVAAVLVLTISLPRIRRQGVLLGVGVASLTYIFVDLVYSYLVRGQSTGNLQTLSGRTLYWDAALELWRQHPIVGAGGYAAGRFGVLQQLGEQTTSSLHNTWIELLVGTGVVGAAIVAVAVIVIGVSIVRMARAESGTALGHIPAEITAILVLEVVRSVFTSGAFIWHPATRVLLAVIVCLTYDKVAKSLVQTEELNDSSLAVPSHSGSAAAADGGVL